MFTWQFWRGFLVHLKEPCCVPRTKSLGTTVLGRSGRAYCSVYKLQDGTEYGLTTTSLISSVSYFNLGFVDLFGRAKPKNTARLCSWRRRDSIWARCNSVGPPQLRSLDCGCYGSGCSKVTLLFYLVHRQNYNGNTLV